MTVLVGYDGHESSNRALDHAIDAARDRDAKLVVLSVFELPFNPEGPQNFGSIEPNEVDFLPLDEPPPELEPTLARARARVEAAGLDADYEWAAGDPADSIVGTARDRNASLVVLGAHEHSWLGRLVGSDVAKEVRDRVDCEVEAV